MQQIIERGGKLYLSKPARDLGPYWVRLKGETQDTIGFYVEYDATDEVEWETAHYVGVAQHSIVKDMEQPVYGHAWCLDQDPENEARCFDDTDFEGIGKRIPSSEQIEFYKTLRRAAVGFCTFKLSFDKFREAVLGPGARS